MTERTVLKISRRNLVTATAIIPAAAIRGSAANSAVTVGLIGCGGRGTHDAGLMVAADSADRSLNITFGFQQRCGPGYRKAKALVDSNGIGRVVAAHSYWVKNQVAPNRPNVPFPTTEREKILQWHEWRELFGDYIVENNVHGIDVMNWFLGSHPTRAVGSGGRTMITY